MTRNIARFVIRLIPVIALTTLALSFVVEKVAEHVYDCPSQGQAIRHTTCVITVPTHHVLLVDGKHTMGSVIPWWVHEVVNPAPGTETLYFIPGEYKFTLEEGAWSVESFDSFSITRKEP